MPDGKKPWEQNLLAEDSKESSKPWERNLSTDESSLKKKVEPTPLPSASEGGTSGLTATPSVSSGTPTETYTVKPGSNFNPFASPLKQVSESTVLGNKLTPSTEMKSVTTGTRGESIVADSKVLSNNVKKQKDTETKSLVEKYEKYKQEKPIIQQSQGKQPFAADDNKNTIDFYMSYLKENDPEEYNYTIQKQAALSKDKQGKSDLEDIQEDDLMIQKFQAETLQKALGLKSRIMSGKYDLAANALKDNYGDLIKNINSSQTKLSDIEVKIKGIDDYLDSNFQKDENGQIITTPQNRKVVEDFLNKRNEFISEYENYQGEMNAISENKDFSDAMTLLDETEKTYNTIESMYRDFTVKNPDVLKGLPEYKKQVEKEKESQKMKDFTEAMTGGDLGISESIARGATGILSALSFIPKSLSFNDDYEWTDKLYDVVKSNVDDFDAEYNPLPTGYDKPVRDSNTGEWNLKYLPGKIAGTITEMAPIIAITALTEGATAGLLARAGASGELGTTLGAFAGEYVAVADDFYSEAKASGMGEKEAMSFARGAATTQAVLGAIYPDIKLARASAAKSSYNTYVDNISKGASKLTAVKEAGKDFAEKLLKEIPQENLQTVQEIYDKNEMYSKMGLNDKIQESVKDAVVETTILSSIVTLGLGAKGVRTPSRMQQESIFMAASQPEDIMMAAKSMLEAKQLTQEQFNDVTMKVAKANFALSKIDKSLPAEKKIKILVPLMEKLDLKEEASQLDDSQKELFNDKIAKKDAEIKGIVSSISDQEQEDALNEEDFLKSIQDEIDAKKQKRVEIPESENQMQREGLFEIDDSQKTQPIELSAKPENESSISDNADVAREILDENRDSITLDKKDKIHEAINNYEDGKILGEDLKKVFLDNGIDKDFLSEKVIQKTKPSELVADEKPTVEEKQQPIEDVESKISDIKKAMAANDQNFRNEKINNNEYWKNRDALETDLKKLEQGELVQENQVQPTASEEIVSPATEQVAATDVAPEKATSSPEILKEEVVVEETPAQPKEDAVQTTTAPKTKEQISAEQSITEDEDVDSKPESKEDEATIKKMDDDVEVLKSYNKEKYPNKTPAELKKLIEDKYVGVLARAYKAKMEGKIAGPTYTAYRNELNKMMEEKLRPFTKKVSTGTEGDNIRKGELKAQVVALGERVKERLLGEGYKNIALSVGMPGPTPEMIGKLVDLTVKGVNYAIDAGFGAREAVSIAFNKIKANPTYQRLVKEGNINEKEFEKEVYRQFSKAKVEPQPVTETEVKTGVSEEQDNDGEEKPKSKFTQVDREDLETGEVKKRKTTERLEANEGREAILERIPDDVKNYNRTSQKKAETIIGNLLDEYENNNQLMDLADVLLDDKQKSPFPDEINEVVKQKLADRLSSMAENSDNKAVSDMVHNVAGKLLSSAMSNITKSATITSNQNIIAKTLPISKGAIKAFVKQQIMNVNQTLMSKKNNRDIDAATKELVDLQVKQELEKIAEGTMSKESIEKVKGISSLKIDLTDC